MSVHDTLVIVCFFLEDTPADWDGTVGEPAAVVRFGNPDASSFGAPNDEPFAALRHSVLPFLMLRPQRH